MNRFIAVLALCAAISGAGLADTWKAPLADKEPVIEAGIVLKHNIEGLYPSLVEIPRHGKPLDIHTTNPFADIQHAVCWTANYLAGLSFKIATLEKSGASAEAVAAARARADEVFEAIYRCQLVTGRRGLQARGYFLGHGEVYAEREEGAGKLPFWRQGTVDGQDYRWVGDPSHHNYSDSVHGLIQYYTLAAQGEQKERAREAIDALVSYWVDNDLNIDKYDRSLPTVPILGITDGKTLNTRVMMAIAGAKYAHHATGKEKFQTVYQRLIDEYGVRNLETFVAEKDFDDAEHVLCHLEVLMRIEEDAELRRAYRIVADGLWASHTEDAQSLFTYIYYGLAPDAPEKEQRLQEALYTLQTWPTDMTQRPQMNSLFPDRKPPYPTYQAAWDNEYIWKGSLLRGDGWLSRAIVDVDVSPEDPAVIYAVGQEGEIYQSRDGAATWDHWYPITERFEPGVRDVAAGHRSRIVAAATSQGFYLTVTGGELWRKLPVPAAAGDAIAVAFSSDNPDVLIATGSHGVYRSVDMGEEFLGESWECLSEGLPPRRFTFYFEEGAPGRIYAVQGEAMFARRLDEKTWTRGANHGFGEYAVMYPWLLVDPDNPDHIVAAVKSEYGGMGAMSFVQESMDAGQTWTNDMPAVLAVLEEEGIAGLMQLTIRGELNHAVADPANPGVLYASGNGVVRKSSDWGKTWTDTSEGLRIPSISGVFKPAQGDAVFASTPGGLYISRDGNTSWTDGNLWLQFDYNTRRELGGAAFIDAYWRGRYYGFIDDASKGD